MSNDKTDEETSKNNSEVEEIDEETSKNEESTDEGAIDYKAELEKERKAREKAESDRDNYRKGMLKAKKSKKKPKEEDIWDDDEEEIDQEELINKKVNEVISEKSKEIARNLTFARTNEILDEMSSSESEKELMKFHLEHTINPSGDLRKDVQDAKLIANRQKLLKENEELKASLKSKNSIRNSSVGTEIRTTNKVTDDDRALKKLQEEAERTGKEEDWAQVLAKRVKRTNK